MAARRFLIAVVLGALALAAPAADASPQLGEFPVGGTCFGINDTSDCEDPVDIAESPDGARAWLVLNGGDEYDAGIGALRRTKAGVLRRIPGARSCLTAEGGGRCLRAPGLKGAADAVPAPDGRTVYVVARPASDGDDLPGAIAVVRSDPRTGALSSLPGAAACLTASGRDLRGARCRRLPAAGRIDGFAVAPDGRTAYAAVVTRGEERGALVALRRDPATGALAALGSPTRVTGAPGDLAVAPDGRSLAIALGGDVAVRALAADGAIGGALACAGRAPCSREPLASGVLSVRWGRAGRLYAAGDEALVELERSGRALRRTACAGREVRGCAPTSAFVGQDTRLEVAGDRIVVGDDSTLSLLARGRRGLRETGCATSAVDRPCDQIEDALTTIFTLAPRGPRIDAAAFDGATTLVPGLGLPAGRVVPARDGSLELTVRCELEPRQPCAATISLTTGDTRGPAPITAATRTARIGAGGRARLRFRLSRLARRYAQVRGGTTVGITARTRGADGATRITRGEIALALPKGGLDTGEPTGTCRPPSSEGVLEAPTGRVYRRLRNGQLTSFACAFATGREVALDDNDGRQGTFFARPAALVGPFLAYAENLSEIDGADSIDVDTVVVADLRSGALTRICPLLGDRCGRNHLAVDALVATATGAVAWVAQGEVFKRDADAPAGTPLDPSGTVPPGSLRLEGPVVSWTSGGQPRSAVLR